MGDSTLDDLHPTLAHHIVNTLGWPALRPLQRQSLGPLLAGSDALLLAPTAGGKTEAAVFPLLSAMAAHDWSGISLIYVCPIKALLNNLLPRLEVYAGWLGRRAALWHGDVSASARARILREPPDILLTTPESLESMLVSVKVAHRTLFAGVRAIVVDEVHAFAGDDRGWHLLAVLERLTYLAGRPIQRVGLSATVGNPVELLTWLRGAAAGQGRDGQVIAPGPGSGPASVAAGTPAGRPPGEIELDYVGSVENAAKVIATLHRGEKRLVFCDARALVEKLGAALRTHGVTTFLSHASLSAEERRQAEQAFAEARDCVIVATSTLELGIDVGDLDRVIQLNAPGSVASFLQRIGRSGRRAGAPANCLFLAIDHAGLLDAAGLLLMWSRGWVEPVTVPPEPRHIVAQQILALCLQEGQVGSNTWPEWWHGLTPFGAAQPILAHLVAHGFIETDDDMLFIGPAAEKAFGRRHFMELTSVFTAEPQFTVLHGRSEIGRIAPSLLSEHEQGPRLLLLAGRSWRVTWIDWKRRRCLVELVDSGGTARWNAGLGIAGASFELTRAIREVLLGEDPPVQLARRAVDALAESRTRLLDSVHPAGTVITRAPGGDVRWWTWAGYRANMTLRSTLPAVSDTKQQVTDEWLRLRSDLTLDMWRSAVRAAGNRLCLPEPDAKALEGLKFSAALPDHLAKHTLATRLADLDAAGKVLTEPQRFFASGT